MAGYNGKNKAYGLQNALQTLAPRPVIAQRAPTTGDTGYEVGQTWVDQSSGQIYGLAVVSGGAATWSVLGPGSSDVDTLTGDSGGALSPTAGNINILGGDGMTVVGSGSTLTINRDAEGGYPVSQYVVGAAGVAGYTTIQSAINAANVGGGGTVYIQDGTYTEDLTLLDAVNLRGNSPESVVITGSHTPPAAGSVYIQNLTLTHATAIFSSVTAGTATITVETCYLNVTNGFVFDLLNWTGALLIDDCGTGSTNDGVLNNTGGADIKITSASVGQGTGQTFTKAGGLVLLEAAVIGCPIVLQTGSTLEARVGSAFLGTLTTANNAQVTAIGCDFNTGVAAAISHGSSGTFDLSSSSITSSNSPAIDGAGAGILSLNAVALTSNTSISGTLNIGTTGLSDFVAVSCTALTASGTTSINDNVNDNTTINAGTSTGTIDIGNPALGEIQVESGDRIYLNSAEAAADDAILLEASAADGGITLSAGSGGLTLGNDGDITLIDIGNVDPTGARNTNIARGNLTGAFNDTINIGSGDINTASNQRTLFVMGGTLTAGNSRTFIANGGINGGTHIVGISTGNNGGGTQTVDILSGTGVSTLTIGNADNLTAINLVGNVSLTSAGSQLQVEGGAVTDFIGQATLSSGTVTVGNTNIAASDRIFLTYEGGSITNSGNLSYTISAGASFTIESTNGSDANDVSYFIVRQL